jgi:flavin reductase (DIM6/NTAB) family NADH-FMN oxidoreductase RutF
MTDANGAPEPVNPEQFKQGMRRLAAGVTIVTTEHEGERSGLTATAVTSLSAEPPQLLVCVNRTAAAHDLIVRGGRMAVNVLCHKHQRLATRFAGLNGVFGQDRFDVGSWVRLKTGAPVLEDALAVFDCRVVERIEASTHTVFFCRVVDIRIRSKGKPLIYSSGAFARLEAMAPKPKRAAPQKPRTRTAKKRRAG